MFNKIQIQQESIKKWIIKIHANIQKDVNQRYFYDFSPDYKFEMYGIQHDNESRCYLTVLERLEDNTYIPLNHGFLVNSDNIETVMFNIETLFKDISDGYA